MVDPHPTQVTRAPAVDKVVRDMREKIFLRQFDTAQALSENALADSYGVSRGPVRTAIQILQGEGLINVGKNGRKTVVPVSEKFMDDLYETRTMIETQAVEIAFRKDRFDTSPIAVAFGDFYQLYSLKGRELFLQRAVVNTHFHRSIVTLADNGSLLRCWGTIEPLIHSVGRFNYIKLGDDLSNSELIESHQQLMDLIVKKDAGAAAAVRDHIAAAHDETNWGLDSD